MSSRFVNPMLHVDLSELRAWGFFSSQLVCGELPVTVHPQVDSLQFGPQYCFARGRLLPEVMGRLPIAL
jgi:hypothetical protein